MRSFKTFLMLLVAGMLLVPAACAQEPEEGEPTEAAADCPEGEVITTDSGLQYEDVECGTGDEAVSGALVRVHYTGKLEDGTEFDSSRGGNPFAFPLGAGQVIQGWDEGIVGMRVGGERILTIPPELGYGKSGYPPTIPPNATLIFDVELVEVSTETS